MRRIVKDRRDTHRLMASRALHLAALLAVVVLSMPAMAGDERLVMAGAANRPLLIREHAAWNSDCKAVPYPTLRLDRPPRHGSVCARAAAITIRTMYTGTEAQCIGRIVEGLRLVYVPQPGFTGNDRLRYSVRYPSVRRHVVVTVSVGAGAGPARLQADTVGAVPEPGQAPGPVPPCAAPVS